MNDLTSFAIIFTMMRLSNAFLAIFFSLSVILAGCARTPSGSGSTSTREMTFQIAFNGPIDNLNRYYIAIDTGGGEIGPEPAFGSSLDAPDAWLAGTATHYVEYAAMRYTIYQITNVQPLSATSFGTPIRYTPPGPGGNTLRFTIDLNAIGATGEFVNVNFFSVGQQMSNVRLLDALGDLGTSYLHINISTDQTITNVNPDNPDDRLEYEGDVLDQNRSVQPVEETRPLDIVDWTITVNV